LGKDTPELRKRPWVKPSPFGLPAAEEPAAEEEKKDELEGMQKTMEVKDKSKDKKKVKKDQ
jgi:hypothetical protein